MSNGVFEKDLFGKSRHGLAIDRLREFCSGKKVLCAFSGGKDSQTCYHLLKEAGVEFHAEYSVTRFEPPELIKFIKEFYPDVTFRRAYKKSLIEEIAYCGLPNMFARWCCAAKHVKTDGYDIAIIGVRWAESSKRRGTWRMFGFKRDKTAYLCPIVEWSDADVWEYLCNRPHCRLYDEGFARIGCVCCPLSVKKMHSDSVRWPRTAAMLRKGGDAYIDRMRAKNFVTKRGKPCSDWRLYANPEQEYWNRWITTGKTCRAIGSIPVDDNQICLFEGSGFSELDEGDER